MKTSGRVIELVNIPPAINLDSSWRSTATAICRKMKVFSHRFASRISHICTEHKPRTFQSLEGTKWCLLTTFLCSTCISLLFYDYVGNLSSRPCYPSADLHETFRYPPNHQDLLQNRETFRHCTVSHHT